MVVVECVGCMLSDMWHWYTDCHALLYGVIMQRIMQWSSDNDAKLHYWHTVQLGQLVWMEWLQRLRHWHPNCHALL